MMNPKQMATIVVVGGALLAWLAGAATCNRGPAPVLLHGIDNSGVALEKEVAAPARTPATDRHAHSVKSRSSFRSAPVRAVPTADIVEAPPAATAEARCAEDPRRPTRTAAPR